MLAANFMTAVVLFRPAEARLGMGATALTAKTFDAFVKKSDKVLVDFYDGKDAQSTEQLAELEAAVREVRGYGCKIPIARVDARREADLAVDYVPKGNFPQLLWFAHGEPTQYHKHLRSANMIATFIMALDRPALVPVDGEEAASNYNRAVFAQVPKDSKMYKMLEVVAAKHMDTVAFTFLDNPSNNVTFISSELESSTYSGDAEVADLENWLRRCLAKSEPVPAEAMDDGSVVVVGKTFEEVVLRPDKDVFLLVYAPWCGFSRKFFPMWKTFAALAAGTPSLVVAKIDGDRNAAGLEGWTWEEYPKLLFVRAGKRLPEVFHGNRTIENMIKFVNQHASAPMQITGSVSEETGDIEL